MYSENYNERFTNQDSITANSSDNFSDTNLTVQSDTSNYDNVQTQSLNSTFFNKSASEFGDDDDIEMLWDDDDVINKNNDNYTNLDNTQVIEETLKKDEVFHEIQNNNIESSASATTLNNNSAPIMSNVMDMSIENNYINNKKANKLCILAIISVVIYLIPIIGLDIFKAEPGFFQSFFLVFSSFANIFPIISLCLIVYAKTKYPFNKFVNVLIYIYIAIFIVFVIIYLIYIFSCIGDIPACFKM